jgi:hypothetical protein
MEVDEIVILYLAINSPSYVLTPPNKVLTGLLEVVATPLLCHFVYNKLYISEDDLTEDFKP